MGIKLFVTDMDGTLLDSNRRISDVNREKIRQAVKDGMLFTVATGRMYKSALPYAESLELDVPIITHNGAMIKTVGGKKIAVTHIPEDLVRQVVAFADEMGQYVHIYTEEELYYREHCPESDWYERAAGVKGIPVGDKLPEYNQNVPKMLIMAKSAELIPDLLAKFQQRFGDRLQGQNSDPTYIEVMAAGVSKASSMLKLAELFGVEQKDILAIGDSGNDVDMIKAAGVGVAVANARPSAMEAARYHVGANVDNGVAEAIDRFFYGR